MVRRVKGRGCLGRKGEKDRKMREGKGTMRGKGREERRKKIKRWRGR